MCIWIHVGIEPAGRKYSILTHEVVEDTEKAFGLRVTELSLVSIDPDGTKTYATQQRKWTLRASLLDLSHHRLAPPPKTDTLGMWNSSGTRKKQQITFGSTRFRSVRRLQYSAIPSVLPPEILTTR
jgi:hypothetical protein